MAIQNTAVVQEMLNKYLIDYLYTLFSDYQSCKNMPWTREDHLLSKVRSEAQSQTLLDFLTNPVNDDKKAYVNILVIQGEKEGDGKKFYILKLLEACYEAIPHITWDKIETNKDERDICNLFRVPVLIEKTKHSDIISNYISRINNARNDRDIEDSIIELVSSAIAHNLCKKSNEDLQIITRMTRKLIANHMLIVFFQEGSIEKPIEEVKRFKALTKSFCLPNLVFVVERVDDEQLNEEDKKGIYYIDLQPLTEKQILRYIAIELPDNSEIYVNIKNHKEILRIFSKQERLLKQILIWKSDKKTAKAFSDKNGAPSILQIEESFIDFYTKGVYNLRKELLQAAISEIETGAVSARSLELKEFKKTDFFDGNQFNYSDCKYYLIANMLFKRKETNSVFFQTDPPPKDQIKTIIRNILNKWPQEVQEFFALMLIEESGKQENSAVKNNVIDSYFAALRELLQNEELSRCEDSSWMVYAKTLCFSCYSDNGLQAFMQWAIDSLHETNCKRSVFLALSTVKESMSDKKRFLSELENRYKKENADIQRRIVNYYTHEKVLLPECMLNDLQAEDVDSHLQYHILDALIANANTTGAGNTNCYRSKLPEWVQKTYEDPLLQVGFELAFKAKRGKYYDENISHLNKLNNLLLCIIQDGKNQPIWRREHAVDFLRQIEGLDAFAEGTLKMLFNTMNTELAAPSCDLNESLRLIRCIVFACCTIVERDRKASNSTNDESDDSNSLFEQYDTVLQTISNEQKRYIDSIDGRKFLHGAALMVFCGILRTEKEIQLKQMLSDSYAQNYNFDELLQKHEIDPQKLGSHSEAEERTIEQAQSLIRTIEDAIDGAADEKSQERSREKEIYILCLSENSKEKAWANKLSEDLAAIEGIKTVLEPKPGEFITQFMEQTISKCDYVLFVCAPECKKMADNRDGIGGYASNIITGKLLNGASQKKFIPVLAMGCKEESIPLWAEGKAEVIMTSEKEYCEGIQKLKETLLE